MKIEYRVRPVTRYVVTRYHEDENSGGVQGHGEFDNEEIAQAVGYALCKAEHDKLGWPLGDERILYPQPIFSGGREPEPAPEKMFSR